MCIKGLSKFTLLCLLLLLATHPVSALTEIDEQSQINFEKIEKEIFFSQDDISIEDLIQNPQSWSLSKDRLNFGLSKETLWVKLAVQNKSKQNNWYLEFRNSMLDQLEVYLLTDTFEVIQEFKGGGHSPFQNRILLDHHFVFPLQLQSQSSYILIFKVKTDGALQVPVKLIPSDEFYSSRQHNYFIDSFFIGLFFILILLNFFYFLFSKDRAKIYYIGYLISFVCFEFSIRGSIFHWLLYEYGNFNSFSIPLLINFMTIFTSLFTIHFLQLNKHDKILHRVLMLFVSLASFLILLSPWLAYNLAVLLAMAMLALACISALSGCVLLGRKEHKEAKEYLIAWLPALLGLLIMAFQKAGFIANNIFTENSALVGNALQALTIAYSMSMKLLKDRHINENMEVILNQSHQKRSAAAQLIHQFFQYNPDNYPDYSITVQYNDSLLQKGSQVFLMEIEGRHLFLINMQIQASDVASMFLFSQIAGFLSSSMKKVLQKISSKDILQIMEKHLIVCESFAKKRNIILEISLFYLNADRQQVYAVSRGGRNYLVRNGRLKDLQKTRRQYFTLKENDLLVFKTLKADEQQSMVEIRLLPAKPTEMQEKTY